MTSYRILAGTLAAFAALAATAVSTRAQDAVTTPDTVTTAPPIVIKQPKPKYAHFRGEVIRADENSVTVRDKDNAYGVRIFTYAPKAQGKMHKVYAHGGYRTGDKVDVRYQLGKEDVALDINGKPSKPK